MASFAQSLLEHLSHQGEPLGEKTLLRPEPKRALRAGSQKSRAVRARLRLLFPFNGANVLVGSAVAIVTVLRADAVAVLCNFAGDPICSRECSYDVAHELRFADAAGVTAHYNHAPLGDCTHVTSLPAWLPTL